MNWLFIDLGKRTDYAATAGVVEVDVPYDGMADAVMRRNLEPMLTTVYELRGLLEQRGVPYPELARQTKQMARKPELIGDVGVVVDTTGVGEAFCDMLRDPMIVPRNSEPYSLYPIAVTITGGAKVNVDERGYNVPKTIIVDVFTAIFQTERIRLHTEEEMPLVGRLREQVQHFTGKLTRTGAQTYSADQEQVHDDLVMCLAMGLWYAEYSKGFRATRPVHDPQPEPYDPRKWIRH